MEKYESPVLDVLDLMNDVILTSGDDDELPILDDDELPIIP